MLKYHPDRYKTYKIYDKAVDAYVLALKFVIEKLDNAIFCNNDIIFSDMDFDIITFFSDDIALNITMLNNVNLDYDDLDDCNPKIINHV